MLAKRNFAVEEDAAVDIFNKSKNKKHKILVDPIKLNCVDRTVGLTPKTKKPKVKEATKLKAEMVVTRGGRWEASDKTKKLG